MMEGLSLGPLLFRWNGLLIALGIAAGALLAAREAKRRDYDPEIIYYLFLPLTIWGTVGARLWHILTPPLSSVELGLTTQYYFSHPDGFCRILDRRFWHPRRVDRRCTCLVIILRAKTNCHFWELADILAPGLALAQAIGRIGELFQSGTIRLAHQFALEDIY